MGISRPLFRRAIALPIAVAIAATTLIAVGEVSASADVQPLTLDTGALPTVQVDGVVWAQTTIGNTVYVGGQFTTARPVAGGSVARANVLAYNLTTGELISSFVADTNGPVQGIAAARDGSRVYIAGSFTTVDGVGHNRIAALDPTTGAPVGSFGASVNGTATGITATSTGIYAIGNFTQANGVAVSKAVAFSPSSGTPLEWKPAFGTGTMRAITSSPNGAVILVGGGFTSVGGAHAGGLAALDASSGQLLPWAASKVVDLGGDATGIFGLSGDSNYAYATGWSYKDKVGENSLEGVVSMDWTTGAINWIEDCHGDSYSSSSMNGILYVASHSHFCANVPNGFGELPANTGHRATAFSVQAAGVLAHNTEQGPGWYQDFGGQPAPVLENFFPDLTVGTFTGQSQAAWSVTATSDYVSYGGEFIRVNGQAQTGLVRFRETASSPVTPPVTATPTPTPTPTSSTSSPAPASKPHQVSKPSAVALGPSAIAVKWTAPKAAKADKVNGYTVKVYKGTKVVKTVKVASTKRLASISGLKKSTSYKVRVAARNAHGTGSLSSDVTAKTKAKGKNVSATRHPSKVAKPSSSVGKGEVRVHWKAAAVKGSLAVSKYQVRVVLRGKTVKTVTVSAKSRSKLVRGLEHKTGYTVSVRAANWAGWGTWSSAKSTRTK